MDDLFKLFEVYASIPDGGAALRQFVSNAERQWIAYSFDIHETSEEFFFAAPDGFWGI